MNLLHEAAMLPLKDFLNALIERGFCLIGQICIIPNPEGFTLRHEADSTAASLKTFLLPDDATEIARWDDNGEYRPLKSAPNLRRGWELRLDSLDSLRLALDLLYPSALANWRAALRDEKISPPLLETLNRQTGMYRITGHLTREETTQILGSLCRPGCLRQILWPIDTGDAVLKTVISDHRIPLLCTNVCSLFLGKAREAVKSRPVIS